MQILITEHNSVASLPDFEPGLIDGFTCFQIYLIDISSTPALHDQYH